MVRYKVTCPYCPKEKGRNPRVIEGRVNLDVYMLSHDGPESKVKVTKLVVKGKKTNGKKS